MSTAEYSINYELLFSLEIVYTISYDNLKKILDHKENSFGVF